MRTGTGRGKNSREFEAFSCCPRTPGQTPTATELASSHTAGPQTSPITAELLPVSFLPYCRPLFSDHRFTSAQIALLAQVGWSNAYSATMLIGYARVSTNEQDTTAQASALKAAGCERIFREKATGGRWNRPELHRLLDHLRRGDVLVVWKLDRLSRSLRDVLTIMERIQEAKAGSSESSLIGPSRKESPSARSPAHSVSIPLPSIASSPLPPDRRQSSGIRSITHAEGLQECLSTSN
jgi:hypothetical protein